MDCSSAGFVGSSTDPAMDCRTSIADGVVLRVDARHGEAEIAAAIAEQRGITVRSVERFRRTAKAKPAPLPLVRVTLSSAADQHGLLTNGVVLGGRACAAELPRAAADSAAAAGRALFDEASISATLARIAHRTVLMPDALPDLPTQTGDHVYCYRRGKFHKGACAKLTPAIEAAASSRHVPVLSLREWREGESVGREAAATGPLVLVAAETDEYRRCARVELGPDDLVLEIGSDLGACCAVAREVCGSRVLGVDLSAGSVERARAAHPSIRFECADVLLPGAARQLLEWGTEVAAAAAAVAGNDGIAGGAAAPTDVFTRVLIDINGSRPLPAVASALAMVLDELGLGAGGVVVVKSRSLHRRLREEQGEGQG